MKRFMQTLLAVALLVVAGAPAFAQQSTVITLGTATGGNGKAKWYRSGATVDSARVSITAEGASADFADTTEWINLGTVKFHPGYTEQALAWFQVNRQLASGTDSLAYQIQMTNDISGSAFAYGSVTGMVTTTAATAGISTGSDGFVTNVKVVVPKTAPTNTLAGAIEFPYKYVRLVIQNRTSNRPYFSVIPCAFGWK